MNFRRIFKEVAGGLPGWHTRRRILVFESDDWGSVRMPSRDAFDRLTKQGVDLGPAAALRFNQYDSLEGRADLDGLFTVLSKHKDQHGRSPVFTLLSLVANPDFDAIRQAGFSRYIYEPLPVTFAHTYPSDSVWALWQEGIRRGLLRPQFHGREHLNVFHWIKALQAGDPPTRSSFQEGVWGFHNTGVSYQAAFDFQDTSELTGQTDIIADGLHLFESLMGYRASFFVPPNGLLSERLYPLTARLGIKYLYASLRHYVPVGGGAYRAHYQYLGKKNSEGQRFITRNAFFEPSEEGRDWVAACLADIECAFRWRKPAIVGTHRVNFTGSLAEDNRKRGLHQLDELLAKALKRWPDLEFMSTPELAGQMEMV